MARSKSSYFNTSPAVQNVALPQRIKCNRCRTIKNPEAFSTKQQTELKKKILDNRHFNASTSEWISCQQCTQTQQFEFECFFCNKVKAREKFSGAQLKNPDKARCWDCMRKKLDNEPGGESDDDTGSSFSRGSDDSEYDGSDDDAGSTLPGIMDGMSLNGSSSYPSSGTGGVRLPSSGGITSHTSAASAGTPTASRMPSTSGGAGTGSSTTARTPTPPHLRKSPPPLRKAPPSVIDSEASSTTGANGTSFRGAPAAPSEKTLGGGKFTKVRAGPYHVNGVAKGKKTGKKALVPDDNDGDDITVAPDSDEGSD